MWTCEYDETGGYECMTAAYLIMLDGEVRLSVDLAYFGQSRSDEPTAIALSLGQRVADRILAAFSEDTQFTAEVRAVQA